MRLRAGRIPEIGGERPQDFGDALREVLPDLDPVLASAKSRCAPPGRRSIAECLRATAWLLVGSVSNWPLVVDNQPASQGGVKSQAGEEIIQRAELVITSRRLGF